MANNSEISPVLAQALGGGEESAENHKAYLFPVVARHTVMALLVATGEVVSAQIELLCQAAGMRLEAVTRTWQASEGVPPGVGTGSWEGLSPADRMLHLQAQRMARLRVAEMRLYHENDLKAGVAATDVYAALREQIDAARREFLESFLSKTPTMVDYLHLEILRRLAHDDDRLLGQSYPGPMVDNG